MISIRFSVVLLAAFVSLQGCFLLGSGGFSSGGFYQAVDGEIERDPELSNARFLFIRSELISKNGMSRASIADLIEVNGYEEGKSPTVLSELAEGYLRLGDFDQALASINAALAIRPDSEKYLRFKAASLSAMGRNREAISVYNQLIKSSEKVDEEAYLLLSGIYLQNGDTKNSLEILESLVKKNPTSLSAKYYLAKLYTTLRHFDQAERVYLDLLGQQKSEPLELEYVKVLVLGKKVDKAISYLQGMISVDPESYKAREMLGELLVGQHKVEEAIGVFQDAESSDVEPSKVKLRVALLKLQIRDFEGAEEDLLMLLGENPENDLARFYLASAVSAQDRIGEAVELLGSIKPTSEQYKKSRGFAAFLLREQERHKEALEFIEEAEKSFPDDIELLGYKVAIYKESNDLDGAYKSLLKISELEPKNDQHLFNLGVLEEERGNKDSSLEYMQKVIKLNPKNSNALNFVGYSYAEQGIRLDEAEGLIKEALVLEPENGYFLDSLGWVYYQQEKYALAVEYLRKAVGFVPADGLILMHYGEALVKNGDKKEAKAILEKSLKHLELDVKEEDNATRVRGLLRDL